MKRRLRWGLLGAAAIAAAGGGVAWVAAHAPARPVHLWVYLGSVGSGVGPDGALRASHVPRGEQLAGWSVTESPTSSLTALLSGTATSLDPPQPAFEVVAHASTTDDWLRRVGIVPAGVRSFRICPFGEVGNFGSRWCECVEATDSIPADAVADAAIAGTWTWSDAGDSALQHSDTYVLLADGMMRYDVRHSPRTAGEPEPPPEIATGRWGRVADVVYVDLGIQVLSDYRTNLEVMILGADCLTWRRADGATARRSRP